MTEQRIPVVCSETFSILIERVYNNDELRGSTACAKFFDAFKATILFDAECAIHGRFPRAELVELKEYIRGKQLRQSRWANAEWVPTDEEWRELEIRAAQRELTLTGNSLVALSHKR